MRVLQVIKTSECAFWAVRQVTELIRHGLEVHVVLPSQSGPAVPAWQETGAVLHYVDCRLPNPESRKNISSNFGCAETRQSGQT